MQEIEIIKVKVWLIYKVIISIYFLFNYKLILKNYLSYFKYHKPFLANNGKKIK